MLQIAGESKTTELRDEAERCIEQGRFVEAASLLSEVWHFEGGSTAAASYVTSRFERIRSALSLRRYRVAIARSATVEPAIPVLRAAGFAAGLDLVLRTGDFNAYVQEMVDAESALYHFQPQTVILAVESRDCAPRIWYDWADLSAIEAATEIRRAIEIFRQLIVAFRKHSRANLIVHSLRVPELLSHGVLDNQVELGQAAAFQEINRSVATIAREQVAVYILDYDALAARHGRQKWQDERKWLSVRVPFAANHVSAVAREWMRFLHPLSGKVAKVIAVDLDNTLWGGVAGEDGIDGIKLGREYPGAAYRDLQRALLDLRRRGILLAICSKNNADEAMGVIERHPEMLLRPEDFACSRINWNDKSTSLLEIAADLNIGIDSIAFLDDSPVERQQVRRAVPDVMVVDLPSDPLQYAQALRDAPFFERLSVSDEDRHRAEMHQADRERQKAQSTVESREDFYHSLKQEAEIGRVSPVTLARVTQLIQKTNQFNLTTRRYTEQEIACIAKSSGSRVYWIRVRDRFGDNGLVGVAIVNTEGTIWEIDTFLLSCRVIGRTVETALIAFLLDQASIAGADRVCGWFFATKKNAPARDFYAKHGFRKLQESDVGAKWSLELAQRRVQIPDWIQLTSAV